MNKEELHMDKTVRDKLDSFAPEPPQAVWDNILMQLAEHRRKKRIIYLRLVSAAAAVVLAFIGGWFFYEKQDEIIPQQVSVETAKEKNLNTKKQENITTENRLEISVRQEEAISGKMPGGANLLQSEQRQREEVEMDTAVPVIAQVITEKTAMEKIKGIAVKWERDFPEQLVSRQNKFQRELNEPEQLLVAENIKAFEKESGRQNSWGIGIQVTPGYSSQNAEYGKAYSNQMTYPGSDGNGTLGGGLSVRYKTGKRWKVESGIYYARNGQKSNNNPVFASLGNQEFVSDEKSYFNTPVVVALSNAFGNRMTMNSVAGVIEFAGTPQGTELAARLDQTDRNETVLLTSGEFSQVFDLLEIPLYVRYSVVDSKFGLDILGGLNAGLIAGNNVYMNNYYGSQNVGKTRDISTINFSGTLGIGFSWDISRHISFSLEPRINYYLNSINTNPEVDFHPYRIGLFTGFNYEF